MTSGDGPARIAAADDRLRPFLASAIFVLPWISWQAWVLGNSFRQRRGQLVADRPGKSAVSAASSAAATSSAPSSPPTPVPRRWRPVLFVVGETLLFLFAQAWLGRVLAHVPEPYLDEVFHIPQAQTYCQGRWFEWDDKITTPPGLYLFSVLYQGFWTVVDGGSVWALRGANNIAIMLVAVAACACRAEVEHQAQQRIQARQQAPGRAPWKLPDSIFSLYAFHTALNVALFPVLFFFSALYYTDVYSTLVTLLAYRNHLFRRQFAGPEPPPAWSGLLAVVLGLATLLMRQTNIFWVAVYMGGLEAVQAVKALRLRNPDARPVSTPTFATPAEAVRFYAGQYALGDIHDPPIGASFPDDWILSLVSVGVAAVCHPVQVLLYVWPHVAVLAGFAGFVAWNGGVVLGDKSNHVATLHLAQMLYIWPLFAFFSAPLFLSHAVAFLRRWTGRAEPQQLQQDETPAARKIYYPVFWAAVVAAMAAVVHFNTIIHPFTLADNRHYMFYVFRYTIRRPGGLRYALVPVYAACCGGCWRLLWGTRPETAGEFVCSPFTAVQREPAGSEQQPVDSKAAAPAKPSKRLSAKDRKTAAAASAAAAAATSTLEEEPPIDPETAIFLSFLDEEPAAAAAQTAAATSTVLLWLLATTLSLITAPLVEPRYFILPWVFWRLLVPAVPAVEAPADRAKPHNLLASLGRKLDVRLILETLWFCAISAATMYIFLFRPYVWRAEDGTVLDDGRLQRFMW